MNSNEPIRVFRCQLSQSNKYFSERHPNYDLLEMSDAALADKMKDVVDALNSDENQYPESCDVQNICKKLSSTFMLEIDYEPDRVTKKILKKLALLEKGDEDFDAYDSDDSAVMSQSDQKLLDNYQEEEKEEFGETLGNSIILKL